MSAPKPKTAFVFAGGAAMGAAQVGMLRALLEAGICPDLMTAVSAGAWNAAFFARGPSLNRISELEAWWGTLSTARVFPRLALIAAFRGLWGGHAGLFDSKPLVSLARKIIGETRFEDLPLPLGVIATDLDGARARLFRKGRLLDAILASSSIPGLFPPVPIEGTWYVDGAVITNVPLAPAKMMGADRYVILDPGVACKRVPSGPPTLLDVLARTTTVASRQRVQAVLPEIAKQAPVLYLSLSCPVTFSPFDFDHCTPLIEEGYKAATSLLEMGWPDRPGLTGMPHEHPIEW